MAWVGKDLKDHLVSTPCHRQGHLPLYQIAQGLIQPGLGETHPKIDEKEPH